MERIKSASLLTAIKTPYRLDGTIDIETYDALVESQISNGVEGLIVGGTTGEGHLMNWDEHLMLIAHSANKYGDKLIIVGNTGSNNTREAVKATRYGFASGMHAALQINPYYGKTSETGLKNHFERVLDIGPAFVYNVPGRTGQDLQPSFIETIATHPNFVGMKECMGSDRIGYYESLGICCWSGSDDSSYASRHQQKSHGVISVTSNLLPGLMRRLMDEPDDTLNEKLQPIMGWLFSAPNPIPISTALSMTGAVLPAFRLPYVPLSKTGRQNGLELMEKFDPSDWVGPHLQLLEDEDFKLF